MDLNGHKINDGKDVIRSFKIQDDNSGEPENPPSGPNPHNPGSGGNGELPTDNIGAYYFEDGIKKYAWYFNNGLPMTGFAPNCVTLLKPLAQPYMFSAGEIRISIPALSVNTSVFGVPWSETGYDVSWLGSNAGWLQDTAFPGRMENGNSVITGHVADTQGKPGIFSRIEQLKYGDQIFIDAFGERYTYLVEDVTVVYPDTLQVLSQDRDYSELTLLTCKYWNDAAGVYDGRVVVRSILNSVEKKP